MKIAICEDEKAHLNNLNAMIQDWAGRADVEVDISAYDDAESLLILWGDVIFDVLILDIEMKKMNGMELARAIRLMDEDVIIIFVTSHTSYSLEGYDVNPLHYLTKPLSEQKFHKALDKACAMYQLKVGDCLIINTGAGLERVLPDKICYISMLSHNAEVVTTNGTYVTRMTLKEITAALPSHFINCHRSYVVNIFKVNCVFSDRVVLLDNTEIPVSRSRIRQVRELFFNFGRGDL